MHNSDYRGCALVGIHERGLCMAFRSQSLMALMFGGLALTSGVAHAEPSPTEIATAKQAFENAVLLEADQKWVDATSKLHVALAIKDTPGLRFHLAHCEERQGFLVEAALDYDRASELLKQGAKAPDVQKLLVPASAELKRRIPRVTVEIPTDAVSPAAQLDGKAYAPSELALGEALNPGPHQLKVSASGRSPFESSFSLKEGDQLAIVAELPVYPAPVGGATPAGAPVTPSVQSAPLPRVDSSASGRSAAATSARGYLLVGESALTVAGLALGIGYALAESSARDRVAAAQARIDQVLPGSTSACSSPTASLGSSCADLSTAINDHDRDATWSTIGFVTAGVGATALLTTWLVYRSADAESTSRSVEPVVAFGHIGLRGRF